MAIMSRLPAARREREQREREYLVALLLAQTALLDRVGVPESLRAEAESIAISVQDAHLALDTFLEGVDDETEAASLRAQLVAVREQLAQSEAAAAMSGAAAASRPSSGRVRRPSRPISSPPPLTPPTVTATRREVAEKPGGFGPSEEFEVWVAPEAEQSPQPQPSPQRRPPPPPLLQDALAQLASLTLLRRPVAGSLSASGKGHATQSTASSPDRPSHATPAKARASALPPVRMHRHGATQPGFYMQPGAKAIRPSEPPAGAPMQPSVYSRFLLVSLSPAGGAPSSAEAASTHEADWVPSTSCSLSSGRISAGQAPRASSSPQGAASSSSSTDATDAVAPNTDEAWHELLQGSPFQSDSTPDALSPLSGAGAATPAAIEGTRDALRRKLRSCDARLSELAELAAEPPQLSKHEAFSYYQALRYLLALAALVSRVLETPLDVHSVGLFYEVSRLFGPPHGLGPELSGVARAASGDGGASAGGAAAHMLGSQRVAVLRAVNDLSEHLATASVSAGGDTVVTAVRRSLAAVRAEAQAAPPARPPTLQMHAVSDGAKQIRDAAEMRAAGNAAAALQYRLPPAPNLPSWLSEPGVQMKINQGVLPKDRPRPANGARATLPTSKPRGVLQQSRASPSSGKLPRSKSDHLISGKVMASRTPG